MPALLCHTATCSAPAPVVMLKSSRRRASWPSQYSLFDSSQSILPYFHEKNATAR